MNDDPYHKSWSIKPAGLFPHGVAKFVCIQFDWRPVRASASSQSVENWSEAGQPDKFVRLLPKLDKFGSSVGDQTCWLDWIMNCGRGSSFIVMNFCMTYWVIFDSPCSWCFNWPLRYFRIQSNLDKWDFAKWDTSISGTLFSAPAKRQCFVCETTSISGTLFLEPSYLLEPR